MGRQPSRKGGCLEFSADPGQPQPAPLLPSVRIKVAPSPPRPGDGTGETAAPGIIADSSSLQITQFTLISLNFISSSSQVLTSLEKVTMKIILKIKEGMNNPSKRSCRDSPF